MNLMTVMYLLIQHAIVYPEELGSLHRQLSMSQRTHQAIYELTSNQSHSTHAWSTSSLMLSPE